MKLEVVCKNIKIQLITIVCPVKESALDYLVTQASAR